ncbi:MAG: zinc ribbon domain-containing protein [Nitrospinae bacterium]|nr:zinc ribbon domain-containing protein [Nitrospinota bacterium]
MPLYEYHCQDCQKDFTLLQSASVKKEETRCDECGSGNVERKFSTFASNVQRTSKSGPATINDYPNKNVFKLPIPKLRSEL